MNIPARYVTGYLGDIGELKLNGGNAGIRLGYRWQRGNWVFGPELGVEFGSVDDLERIVQFIDPKK